MPAGRAKLPEFQPVLVFLLIFSRRIIAILAFRALQRNDFTHKRKDASTYRKIASSDLRVS
jgi:hypothetical protein